MTEIFNRTYHSIQKHKGLFALVLVLVFGGLIWMASRIQFDEDISKLIPSNDDNAQLQKVLNTVQFGDKIIVNISKTSKKATSEALTDYAQQWLDSLNANSKPYFKNIQGKVEDETIFEALDFAFENAALFLTEADYKTLANKLQKDSIENLMANNYKILASPSGIVAKKTIVKDPLGISLMALQHLKQLGFNKDFKLQDGFLVSNDEQHVLLFITPTFKSSETNQNEVFAEQLYRFQNNLNVAYKGEIQSELFGGTLIAVANAKQIKEDIQLTFSIALVALLLLFVFFYRKWTIPLILMVPTLFGGLLAIAILSLIRSDISAISLGIGAVLLGVTLDYSLHILTHLRNNDTIGELYKDVTVPILMSSVTTALAFLCLLFIDSQALQDLGLLAAVSVLGASVFALVFIPQVYRGKKMDTQRKLTFLDKVARYSFHKNKVIIIGILGLLLTSAFSYQHVRFNNDISTLNYEPKVLKDAEQHLDKLTNETSKSLYIIAFGTTLQHALEANDSVYARLKSLETNKKIISFTSVGALVRSKKQQLQSIANWNQFWTPPTIQKAENELVESGLHFGFKTEAFHEFYDLLKHKAQPLEMDGFKTIQTIPMDDFIASSENFHTITSVVKVTEEQIPLLKQHFKNDPNTMVIDRQNINETLLRHLKTDFNKLIGYCFLVVLLLLLVVYRNWKLTLVTVLPIMLTWFITIGIIGLFRMEFNIFSILISSFIFGLGVDYSIFMTTGLLQIKEGNPQALTTYKTSVLLSVITTILGIGVLILAKHPALYSLSIVSMIGILTAMLIAFTIQPLLFKLLIFDKQRNK